MTQYEKNTLARALGITPEACPWAWEMVCDCGRFDFHCAGDCRAEHECILPDPNSDDLAACVWDGWLLRAMGWPDLDFDSGMVTVHGELKLRKTTTAALLAAWQGREGK